MEKEDTIAKAILWSLLVVLVLVDLFIVFVLFPGMINEQNDGALIAAFLIAILTVVVNYLFLKKFGPMFGLTKEGEED